MYSSQTNRAHANKSFADRDEKRARDRAAHYKYINVRGEESAQRRARWNYRAEMQHAELSIINYSSCCNSVTRAARYYKRRVIIAYTCYGMAEPVSSVDTRGDANY